MSELLESAKRNSQNATEAKASRVMTRDRIEAEKHERENKERIAEKNLSDFKTLLIEAGVKKSKIINRLESSDSHTPNVEFCEGWQITGITQGGEIKYGLLLADDGTLHTWTDIGKFGDSWDKKVDSYTIGAYIDIYDESDDYAYHSNGTAPMGSSDYLNFGTNEGVQLLGFRLAELGVVE